jgi:[ribosomal protein S5]-alanine N-acetyltransferase
VSDVFEKPVLATERLQFFRFTSADLPLIVELHSDPDVQRRLGGTWSPSFMQAKLEELIRDDVEVGYSKWKACLHDGTFVGRAGIQPFPREGADRGRTNELGYAFKTEFWGRGLATEAAAALISWFFANTPHDHLMAMTTPDHAASQHVLQKAGFRALGVQDVGLAEPHALFRIERGPRLAS